MTRVQWSTRLGNQVHLWRYEVRRSLKVTNMHIERRLYECKHALARTVGRIFGETFCYGALTDRLWRMHLSEGGNNIYKNDRAQLEAEGAPVVPLRRRRRRDDDSPASDDDVNPIRPSRGKPRHQT